jgi:hypothetical protein
VQEEEVLHQRATLLIYSRQPPPTLFGENRANLQTMDRDPPNFMTSRQRQGRDSIGTVPPGKDEEHPTHPVSPPITRVGSEQGQPKNIPARTPHTMETVDPAEKQRDLKRFHETLKKKLTRSSTEWTRTGYHILHQIM